MTMTLSLVEIVAFLVCAIILGAVIHFFFVSRRNLKRSPMEAEKNKNIIEEWKLKYFNEVELKDREIGDLKNQLQEAEENNNIYHIEIEELHKQQNKIKSEAESSKKTGHIESKPNYMEQLRLAQTSLHEHNEKINQLLENIEVIKENEEKQKLIEEENEELTEQIRDLKYLLGQKEVEINNIRQKEQLTKEMTSMLDSAYSEFNTLQSKIQKLELQLTASKMQNIEYEDMKESFDKTNRDYEDQKSKLHATTIENQQLTLRLNETEDKLRESDFHRQQLQKRVAYLEELNNDLKVVTDANKKLEHQLRRIGELESMLNVVSEERDQLLNRKESL
jgi:chromosome segregation ATPase